MFFPTSAYRDDGGNWQVPIEGWVCEPRLTNRTFLMVSNYMNLDSFVRDPQELTTLGERIQPFLVDNKTGRRIEVVIAGDDVQLAKSSKDGLFESIISVRADGIPTTQPGANAKWVTYRTRAKHEGKPFEGRAQLLEPTGLSVVSDIDDTIRVTEVLNTKKMIEHTFLETYRPVPGMPDIYRHWADAYGADFHYVSTAPIQLHDPLARFVAEGYPPGSMTLRVVPYEGNALKYVVEIMESPPEWKVSRITPLFERFPQRRFVLVGDSGQSDPEVYAELARKHPGQIRRILIRDTTREDADSPRYQQTFQGLARPLWHIFREPAEIRDDIKPS